MADISKIDRNFAIQESFGRSDIDFYNEQKFQKA